MGRPAGWGLSRAQHELLWQWHREGVSRRMIAARLDKNPGTIHGIILESGGIPPRRRVRSAHHLSLEDRQLIERGLERRESLRTIARWVGCAPSTISRELARHEGRGPYDADRADRLAWQRGRRPKRCRLATRRPLRRLVVRHLRQQWSPRQISEWLGRTFPQHPELQVSHETIYRSLYIQWRICFRWQGSDAFQVEIVDYH